jgi:hypothetical protein
MSAPASQTANVTSETSSRDAAARDSHEDHAVVQHFFSQPTPHLGRDDADLDHDHDHDHEHGHAMKRGMQVTAAIALIGALLIGGFLVYHKLLMPTPEEIAPAPVALPTPDMLRGAPVIEPTPTPVAPAPQEVGPAPKLEAPPSEPELPAAEPAPGAPAAPVAASPEPAATPSAPEAPAAPMPEGYARELAAARTAGFKRNAEQFYLRALAIAPNGAEALSGLAMYYLNQGKNQKAKERAEEAVKADPTSSEGWIVLGASLAALGDGAGARRAYQECAQFEGKYMGECKRMLR